MGQKTISRRGTLAVLGGSIVSFGGISKKKTYPEMDVSIFVSDSLSGENKIKSIIQNATEFAFRRITDNSGMKININTNTPHVNGVSSLSAWENKIDKEYKNHTSKDCNLLVNENNTDSLGKSNLACNHCDIENDNASIVYNGKDFQKVNEESAYQKRGTSPENYENIVSVCIHEIGHSVGMRHEMGTVLGYKESFFDSDALITPMLNGYIHGDKYTNQKNRFGQWIPQAEFYEAPDCHPQFNKEINIDTLNLA